MNGLVLILFSVSILNLAKGQNSIKNYFPTQIIKIDLTAKKDNEIKRQWKLIEKKSLTASEKIELDTLLLKYGEVTESMWEIVSGGCSWYCGGGNYKVKASSILTKEKKITYQPEKANDLDYRTAWVEGKPDEGIGEYIEYYFKNKSPRITQIIITNGYVKSEMTWKDNNRVKKLKLIVNNQVFGILNLEDTRTNQVFEIGTFGHNNNGTDLILKFEILEVYKGQKFNDTAITEIYFDGIDVH